MQETRRKILEILLEREKATVDEIVKELRKKRGDKITSVTVRHHLAKLQEEGLVSEPLMHHRSSPGRPRYIYELTSHGCSFFPNNYQQVTADLIKQMNRIVPPETINVILEGIADDMASEARIPDGTLEERLTAVVEFLNTKGYEAEWQANEDGYLLYTHNCPYHSVAQQDESLCQLDMRLVSTILGLVPRLRSRIAKGDSSCSYFIPHQHPV